MSRTSRTGPVGRRCDYEIRHVSATTKVLERVLKHVDVRREITGILGGAAERHFCSPFLGDRGDLIVVGAHDHREIRADWRAWMIDHAMSGFPPTSMMFFRGMPFEPPRAGISARTSSVTAVVRLRRQFDVAARRMPTRRSFSCTGSSLS